MAIGSGGSIAQAAVDIVADGKGFPASVRKAILGAGGEAEKSGKDTGTDWSSAFRQAVANNIAKMSLSKIFGVFQAGAKALVFSFIGAQAAAAAGGLIQFTAALLPAVGIMAAAPAGIAVFAGLLGTLGIALSGVGDAFGAALSGDAKKFEQSLASLSPAAQTVARDLRSVKPEIDGLKASVQDAFFAPLVGRIQQLASVLIGPLKSGMSSVAAEFGLGASQVAAFATESQSVSVLDQVFATLRKSVSNVTPALVPVLRGFRDLTGVGLPLIEQLSAGVGSLATQFGEWIQQAAASGQALNWINNAVAVFKQLWTIVASVGGIIEAVFRAAQTAGTGVVGTFGQLLTSANAFLSSVQGQQALVTIFQTLAVIGSQLGPIFTAFGGSLALIAPQIAAIALAIGPGIASAIALLGPALAALGPGLTAVAAGLSAAFGNPAFAAGLLQLAQSLSGVLVAVSPLLPLIGQLAGILGSALASAINAAMAVLGPVVDVLSALGIVVGPLGPAINFLAGALGAIIGVLVAVRVAVMAWTAAQWLLNIAMDANPIGVIILVIGLLVSAFIYLWNNSAGFRDFWIGLWDAVKGAVEAAVNWISGAVSAIGDFFSNLGSSISSGVGAVLDWFASLPGKIGSFLASLPGILWSAFTSALQFGLNAVVQGLQWIIAEIIAFPMQVVYIIGQLGVLLWNALTAAWQWASTAVVAGVTAIVDFVIGLPGMIVNGISNLGSMLAGWASAAWEWAKSTTISTALAIYSWVTGLPGRILSGIANLGSMLGSWASNAWNNAVNGMKSAAEGIWGFVKSIPDRILSGLGNLGSLLLGAGKAIINGLLNGIKAAAGAVWDFISGIGDKIKSLKGPLDYDKIMLVPEGKAIIGGLNRGLQDEFGSVRSTVSGFTKELSNLTIPIKTETSLITEPLRTPEMAAAARNAQAFVDLQLARQQAGTPNADGFAPFATPSPSQVTVNAPITMTTQATDPYLVARMTADSVAQLTQV